MDPVQYAIRLLVPPGSLLLTSGALDGLLDAYDDEHLGWSWHAPDPRLDVLQERIAALGRAGRGRAVAGRGGLRRGARRRRRRVLGRSTTGRASAGTDAAPAHRRSRPTTAPADRGVVLLRRADRRPDGRALHVATIATDGGS